MTLHLRTTITSTLVLIYALIATSNVLTVTAAPSAFVRDGPVVINEFVISNDNSLADEDGDNPDWVELYNTGTSSVNLSGYKLTDKKNAADAEWAFPDGTTISSGQFLVVFASNKNRAVAGQPLHTDFALSTSDDRVALIRPDGVVVSSVPIPTSLRVDESFGLQGNSEMVISAQDETSASTGYVVLSSSTPGSSNASPASTGPTVFYSGKGNKDRERPSPGAPVTIEIALLPQSSPVASAQLTYRVMYGPETVIPMRLDSQASESSGMSVYTATIPGGITQAGQMIRWFVNAADTAGQTARYPPQPTSSADPQYAGIVVSNPEFSSTLPVLEMFCENPGAATSTEYVQGCSLLINGNFYDNLSVRRRGVTSLSWPKPKFKINAGDQGYILEVADDLPYDWKEIKFSGQWAEPGGENTFFRETLVWDVFEKAGVETPISFQTAMLLNGQYYGKFALIEELDNRRPLERWGYSGKGPMWKAVSGEFSNLRYDLSGDIVQWHWKKEMNKDVSEDQLLIDLVRGLAGATGNRCTFLFDNIDLPQVINHMAAQTLILNQDRCTKNFNLYREPDSGQWIMLPWDVESGFSIDRGLGGEPAPDYCTLACEQWNSPLFCDSEHPQDLAVNTPWGLISAQYDTYLTGRKLLQNRASQGGGGEQSSPDAFTPRREQYGDCSTNLAAAQSNSPPVGAPGSFNYLIDAILDSSRAREMYMRRLRTLMDEFIATGLLEDMVTAAYEEVKDEAKRDAVKWDNPADIDRGYRQLIEEQLPERKRQLYEVYGPGGEIPLIPAAQPADARITVGTVETGEGGYVEIKNGNAYAVDISGWKLSSSSNDDGVGLTFRAGTVIPANDSAYVAVGSIGAFKERSSSPKGGEDLLIIGPLVGVPISTRGWSISKP